MFASNTWDAHCSEIGHNLTCFGVMNVRHPALSSVVFALAETLVRSPQKICILIVKINIYRIKVTQNMFFKFDNKTTACRVQVFVLTGLCMRLDPWCDQ